MPRDTNGSVTRSPGFPIIVGPKNSRRLGQSLGVDVIPRKACPLDCIYCELGRTDHLTLRRENFVEPGIVVDEVRAFLNTNDARIDHITLSPSGEPTLHCRLGEIVAGIKSIATIPVAILTSGVLLSREEVRNDLLRADVVLPSFDAASERAFRQVNRPHGRLSIVDVVEGLIAFRSEYSGQIWLEILLVMGVNDSGEELRAIKEATRKIRPDRIHLNTVVRKPAEDFARRVDAGAIAAIAEMFGPTCSVA